MVKAEEANNINFQLHETIRSGENKQDGETLTEITLNKIDNLNVREFIISRIS